MIRWAALALLLWTGAAAAEDSYPPLDVLLKTTQTAIGEPIVYPDGQAEVSVVLVTMAPGQKTGWHVHDAPLIAYMLEGEITVDYGENGKRTYREGDALVDALKSRHDGENTGDGPTRILVVFAGAVGTANTVSE
ncbi:MAG: cupin domain-containing protein [Pseudomonadota bacterium]